MIAIMNVNTPLSLKTEHKELHAELAKATKAGGATGEAAQSVAKILHPHFLKEEEYALPPLGLLPVLAGGKTSSDLRAAVDMTDRLKADLNHMLLEHKEIVGTLKVLIEAARSEGKDEFVHFAEKLTLHAQTEEEVLYPASILVGEYLKLKLKLI
ncbi:MAG: hemerythrin domain-containing protein [Methanotrichaceae archaeon]|nr:hemerythrin domain-containing protein [Methanotrichaceae archaeon]